METEERYFHNSDTSNIKGSGEVTADGTWKNVHFGVWRDVWGRIKRRVTGVWTD